MAIRTVTSDRTLASTVNGPPLHPGVPVDVDDDDPEIRNMISAGILTPVRD